MNKLYIVRKKLFTVNREKKSYAFLGIINEIFYDMKPK